MSSSKSFKVDKMSVFDAFRRVKANRGEAGIDSQTIAEFEADLKGNLYKVWNRLSSGSYFPPPVRTIFIAKKGGGERELGIPTVSDRIAQTVVKMQLEPVIEPLFHEDSYGYRPGRSAHQAISITRRRCWKYDWVVEFDVLKLFDTIDHQLLMKAVRFHVDNKWVFLYVERWITAAAQQKQGALSARDRGTPQGGVLSPLLANLFMHYVSDAWMGREFPENPFCRYADDGIVHCRTQEEAQRILQALGERLQSCKLQIHPDKSKIIYCKDDRRRQQYKCIQFDFLGFTFRPRRASVGGGRYKAGFLPAISRHAECAIRQVVRTWKMHLWSSLTLSALARRCAPHFRGWMNYYCLFYKSQFSWIAAYFNAVIRRWAMRKFKKFRKKKTAATSWIQSMVELQPRLFPHWSAGFTFVAR